MTFSTAARLGKTFIAALAIMCALLIAANSIPNRPIADNVRRSLVFHDFQQSPTGAHLDEFTECVAVSVGLFSGHNVNSVRDAFLSPATWGCPRLKDELEGRTGQILDYWRFWHGYQIISRPLLSLFSLRAICMIVFASFCVSVFVFYESIRTRIGATQAVSALAGLLCVSVQIYSSVYLVSHAAVWLPAFLGAAWLLRTTYTETPTSNETLLVVFLILGMVTSFLGFLTTPVVTLTIPLLALYWVARDRWVEPRRPSWRMFALLCVTWAVGYVGCWAAKWAIAAVVFNVDVYGETLAQIKLRLAGDRPLVNTTDVVIDASLANSYGRSLWEVRYGFVGLAGFLVFSVVRALREHGRFVATNPFRSANDALTFAIVFALPLLWIGVVRNHTVVHPWFVPSILYTCFALGFWLVNEAVGARPAPCVQPA